MTLPVTSKATLNSFKHLPQRSIQRGTVIDRFTRFVQTDRDVVRFQCNRHPIPGAANTRFQNPAANTGRHDGCGACRTGPVHGGRFHHRIGKSSAFVPLGPRRLLICPLIFKGLLQASPLTVYTRFPFFSVGLIHGNEIIQKHTRVRTGSTIHMPTATHQYPNGNAHAGKLNVGNSISLIKHH